MSTADIVPTVADSIRGTALFGPSTVGDWLQLIRAEYLEIPGLQLTDRQARRLWNLDAAAGQALLSALVDDGFLRRTAQGTYVHTDIA